ncbi:hypothetical protein, partial [Streptomyces ipomoeae]|uniref:hypothetical protein n=1 Tax=Streptomyces ipomoeae TaxID=103232 RepID=UPI0029A28C40
MRLCEKIRKPARRARIANLGILEFGRSAKRKACWIRIEVRAKKRRETTPKDAKRLSWNAARGILDSVGIRIANSG